MIKGAGDTIRGPDAVGGLRACSSWSASTSATMASTMGTARGTTHGSCRPRATRSVSSPSRLTCAPKAAVRVWLQGFHGTCRLVSVLAVTVGLYTLTRKQG